MSLIQEFKEKALSDAAQFEVHKKEEKEMLYYVKYRVGKATFIFGDYSFRGNFSLETKLSLKAILSEGIIYLVDTFTFYPLKENEYPENVVRLSTKTKEVNDFIQDVLFQKYYENLPIRALTDNEQKDVIRRVRRIVLKENCVIEKYLIKEIITHEKVASLLRGELDIEKVATEYFEKHKERFITVKSENYELQKLVDAKYGVEEWEINMANSLQELDAKNVAVEFSVNGEQGTEKVEKDRLLRMLYDKDDFSSYDFVNGKSGEALLKKLKVGSYRSHENGVLECKHISSIKYGKKVIYSVMQHT